MNIPKTLYEQIGDERLHEIVDRFYASVFASPVIGPLFNQTAAEAIKDKQFCFLTQFLGGPPRYNEKYGPPMMRRRHLPHRIDETAKNEWLSLMKSAIYATDLAPDLQAALFSCFPQVAQHMVNS